MVLAGKPEGKRAIWGRPRRGSIILLTFCPGVKSLGATLPAEIFIEGFNF
jgi:hypothetical protein